MSYLDRSNTGNSSNQAFNRPFSTNNPFRNASVDSSINDPNFQNWVSNNNRVSQASYSSDDDEFDHFRVPSLPRPAVDRQLSMRSTGSNGSATRMILPRRSSNNPFESSNKPTNNELPTYQPNEQSNKYYSSDEKRRQDQQQRQARSPPPPPSQASRPLHSHGELPPPSYEDVVPKSKHSASYPREKASSVSSSSGQPRTSTALRSRSRSDLTSQDRARQEEKERERARRHREHKDRSGGDSSRRHKSSKEEHTSSSKHRSSKSKDEKSKLPAKNVDTIDKLDVTGLFGVGFHHDGPFDACTPHRNMNVKAAPVMAFPADGANNSIKGSNNPGKNSTINYIQGIEDDDDNLYTTSVSNNTYNQTTNSSSATIDAIKTDSKRFSNFDSTGKISKIHGETTLGLGSSTFLDGAPASKISQLEDSAHKANGLGRKKSIRQKILGEEVSAVKFDQHSPTNNDKEKEEKEGNSLLRRVKSLRVGRK